MTTITLIPHRSKWYAAVRFSGGVLDGLTVRVARLGLDASGRLRRIAWLPTVTMDDRAGRRAAGAPEPGAALREVIRLVWQQQQEVRPFGGVPAEEAES